MNRRWCIGSAVAVSATLTAARLCGEARDTPVDASIDATALAIYRVGNLSMQDNVFDASSAQSPTLGEMMGNAGMYVMALTSRWL